VLTLDGASGALAYDQGRPDRVYVAAGGGVRASADGGATWADLGRQGLPAIRDLVLSPDGEQLYAATEQALYRLRLEEPTRRATGTAPGARRGRRRPAATASWSLSATSP
jgi:hypothetical protein